MEPEKGQFEAESALDPLGEAAVMRAFLDNAPAFFVVKDAEGRYVYVNRFVAAAQKRSDLLGKSAHDLMPLDVADATRRREVEILNSGVSQQSREVFAGPDGQILSASLLRFPIDTPSQRLLGVIGLDVTELARAQHRQAALLDLATDAIHVRDLAGRITYWNRAAERLYGWSAAEAQGRNALEILFPQDGRSTEALAGIQERLLHDSAWSGELNKVTRSGAEVIVESRWTLLRDDHGQPDALLVIDSDITQKKQIEQQLLRAVRIDTIGSLAGGVAHDLNNMLMPILMGAAIIRKRIDDPQLARTVDHLEESAKRAADLVRQILTFIRGSRDVKEIIAGEQLMMELQKFLQATFPPSLRIESHSEETLPPVLCRPSEIHQVLVNLCVNARDAMGESGTLVLEAGNAVIDAAYARMSITAATPGPYLAIAISDSGKGIPPDRLATVFEPYFTTKEPGQGTGLGLSNAAAIVQELGGFIAVESERGRTTFTVFLPAAEGAPGPALSIEAIPGGSGETILVVDDEGAVVQVVRETLEAFNYRVMTASDGSEAITLLATEAATVRLVITDVAMPIVDGIALAKFIRRAHPGLKVIIASGSNDSQRREAAEHAHASLQKPYTADTLLRLVADLLAPDQKSA
jgi:two-component system cell cycle sensor histidine kinase/response regulator CckA